MVNMGLGPCLYLVVGTYVNTHLCRLQAVIATCANVSFASPHTAGRPSEARASLVVMAPSEAGSCSAGGYDRAGQVGVRLVGDGPLIVQGSQIILAEAEEVLEYLTGVLPKEG